ncbi:MAG: V-type ATP synthase subunit D [Clostridia bacterium]|nr:V-type ATP synthase subunit D [Clostridia bacterium]MBQ3495972.1 V-type ATP synthase subunit D [Clostridia bacterium]MBQ4586650.1 V-type ATP synthase subunit D [Clostridia bacterium]MBQ6882826.1 V-type ATP synthase subunit D [Clostridia bacterium]MBR2933309.1 V-type ATP synthase subunit D [Clostridia bacterium]
MARLNVNPTRMELKKLKNRHKTAVRGHKLLKDKSDEMIRRFSVYIKENKRLREQATAILKDALTQFANARALMGEAETENAFSMPSTSLELNLSTQSVMNVMVPDIEVKADHRGGMPYSYAQITSEADYSVRRITDAITILAQLAAVEKKVQMLADEIVRNKRRVNALEYVMIPQLEETIHYITSKLGEDERSALTRLMKVKSMINEKNGD